MEACYIRRQQQVQAIHCWYFRRELQQTNAQTSCLLLLRASALRRLG